jgi:P-type E1-E2 ATPase
MRPAGPVVDPLPCSGCGRLLDPLRAGHVAIFDARVHHFCSRGVCRARFLREAAGELAIVEAPCAVDEQIEARRAGLDEPIVAAFEPVALDASLPGRPPMDDDRLLIEPISRTILTDTPPRFDVAEPRDIGTLLLVIAIAAGALAVALALAGATRIVDGARIVLALVGIAMLVGRAVTTPREAGDPHPAALIAPAAAAVAITISAAIGADRPLGSEAASLAGIIVTASAVSLWLVDGARRAVQGEREWIEHALSVPARRVKRDETTGGAPTRDAYDLRSGEALLVEAGEVVPVDLTVAGDDVDVYPWLGATTPARRRAGDAVIAGARVARGSLHGVCTWTGHDRAFARVLLDPRRRADALAPIVRASRALVARWALAASVIGALSAVVAGRRLIEIAMIAVAIYAAFASAVTASIAAVHIGRGILVALRRGITFKSSDAWDRAGQVTAAVFCARGTLLLGEPELSEIEPTHAKIDKDAVLALAAGAERTGEHPIAHAILRAARSRGVRPDGVRNPSVYPGMGVTAITSAGEPLCVGNRMLLLEQRISIAHAEPRMAELEALGRAVVLVAVGARLVGLLALQDGLRPGARAAVQHMLDASIEPVLMSGDARETCEAIARSLDIEHVRPEVLPDARSMEVRRLIDAGASVAVLGHPTVDEAALGAADVAVALGAAGSTPGDFAVALASDDVRDAALSLAIARRARGEARTGLALACGPAFFGSMAIAFGVLPPAFAPLAALVGAVMAVTHVRALDRLRS